MKKLVILTLAAFVLGFPVFSGQANAENEHPHEHAEKAEMVKVYQCPMDKYTVPANCPLCGMQMEEKEMTAAEAQDAMDKAKAQMKKM